MVGWDSHLELGREKGTVCCSIETELSSDAQLKKGCRLWDTHHVFVGNLLLGKKQLLCCDLQKISPCPGICKIQEGKGKKGQVRDEGRKERDKRK